MSWTAAKRLLVASCLVALPVRAALAATPETKFRAAPRNGIANHYIVVLAGDSSAAGSDKGIAVREVAALKADLEGRYAVRVKESWAHALKGFSIVASEEAARRLACDPRVRSVEQDVQVSVEEAISAAAPYCSTQCLAPYDPQYTAALPVNTRANPTSPQSINCANPDPGTNGPCVDNWGIDRSDQALLPRDGVYNFSHTGGPPGTTVHVYVIDVGILSSHHEFTGRIGNGINVVTGDGNLEDCSCYHHGTGVASVIGGSTYGVAKGVVLHSVKVIDFCAVPSGQVASIAGYVTALNWIVQNHVAPSVANLSGGNTSDFVASSAFSNAVKGLIQAGVTFVQSAGNEGNDACGYSEGTHEPTGVPDAIIAGGITELTTDGPLRNGRWVADYSDPLYGGTLYSKGECVNRPSGAPPDYCGSNYGSCVTLWAPSQYIITAGWDQDPTHYGAYCLFTGTSFAAPHVSGVAALYLQNHPASTPQQVKAALVAGAKPNVLQTTGNNSILTEWGSPNLLLQIVP